MTYNETLGFDIDTNLELSDFSNEEIHDDRLQEILEGKDELFISSDYYNLNLMCDAPTVWCDSLCTYFLEPRS